MSLYVIILVQCNFFMSFQSIVIPVRYHNKFSKFVCNVIDLCTTYGQIIKFVWSFPLMKFQYSTNVCAFGFFFVFIFWVRISEENCIELWSHVILSANVNEMSDTKEKTHDACANDGKNSNIIKSSPTPPPPPFPFLSLLKSGEVVIPC